MTSSASSSDSGAIQWHYSIDGQRFGPVSEHELRSFIQSKRVTETSLVWHSAMDGWSPILSSPFSSAVRDPSVPPPLTGAAIDNTVIWILAFAPLLGLFLEGFLSGMTGFEIDAFFWVTIVLNIGLTTLDEKKLKLAGHDTTKMGASWIVPVYIYKRSQVLRHNLAYFITWCVCFAVILFDK